MIDIVRNMFQFAHMDWNFAIERNREPLLGYVMGLFAKIGLTEGGMVERLPRPLYRKVLVTLKAAEIRRAAIDHRHGAQHCGRAAA